MRHQVLQVDVLGCGAAVGAQSQGHPQAGCQAEQGQKGLYPLQPAQDCGQAGRFSVIPGG